MTRNLSSIPVLVAATALLAAAPSRVAAQAAAHATAARTSNGFSTERLARIDGEGTLRPREVGRVIEPARTQTKAGHTIPGISDGTSNTFLLAECAGRNLGGYARRGVQR